MSIGPERTRCAASRRNDGWRGNPFRNNISGSRSFDLA
jgi:hypothetical protein